MLCAKNQSYFLTFLGVNFLFYGGGTIFKQKLCTNSDAEQRPRW